jgi:predicted lactoylglutathione lyase
MTTEFETALQASSVTPALTVDDLRSSIRFFEGLGFAVDETWEDDNVLVGVMMRAGHARIGLTQDDWSKGSRRHKGDGMRIFVGTTQPIDEVAERATASGIELDSQPQDTAWGRAFDVTEPSGFQLTIWSQP